MDRTITCPVCSHVSGDQTKFERHVTCEHNTSSRELWDTMNCGPRRCACGCNAVTAWHGWRKGYASVVRGHNGRIYDVYDTNAACDIATRRSKKLVGRRGWARGLTKDDDSRIARSARSRRRITKSNRASTVQPAHVRTGCDMHEEVRDMLTNAFKLAICNDMSAVVNINVDVDIYIPTHRFALRLHRLTREACASTSNNARATALCAIMGVHLFHVFEDEWRDKQIIVTSMLKKLLDVDMKRVDVDECIVRHVDVRDRREFMTSNHIDGDVSVSMAIGLYHDGELVQCISIRMPRHNSYRNIGMYEIARECTAAGVCIEGGMNVLSRHALQWAHDTGLMGLIAYVDRRHGEDSKYQHAGWQFANTTKMSMHWKTDGIRRWNACKNASNDVDAFDIYGCKKTIYTMFTSKLSMA